MARPRRDKIFRGRLLRDLEAADFLIARDRWEEEGRPDLANRSGMLVVPVGYLRGASREQLRGLEAVLPARAVLVPVDGSGIAYPRSDGKRPRPMTAEQLHAALVEGKSTLREQTYLSYCMLLVRASEVADRQVFVRDRRSRWCRPVCVFELAFLDALLGWTVTDPGKYLAALTEPLDAYTAVWPMPLESVNPCAEIPL